ncbi:primosomal protein N' (replication factor Y) - superfamily II helicase [Tropicimonas sp. S265A]|uniref:primosomal protein N' (replication factor Y) - superfamily II helicase n=1 Tax=Tropicimonas sp. S265A TaxID=3415134 RepID=UPI003C7D519F
MTDFAPPPAPAVEEHRFPCTACGADLRFAPGADQMVCDHCGNTQKLGVFGPWAASSALREIDYLETLRSGAADAADEEVTRVLSCTNCGAQVEFQPEVHAAECPFCATPVVTDTGTHRHIKPAAVIPFEMSEDAAKQAMTDWLGRLWFAPNGLQEYARKGRKMSGIYVPYWTYDARTDSRYRGQRGTVYYVQATRVVNGKRVATREARVRWRAASGHVARAFDDVLVLAARSLPKRFTDALAPWDLSALIPYTPEPLAGFRAEGYTVPLEEGMAEARAYMDRVIARDVRMDIGGDRQRIDAIDTRVSDVTFKHILLPVWVAAYRYGGKSYRFVVNGQDGKVSGERPYSAVKIALAVIALVILGAALAYGSAVQQG